MNLRHESFRCEAPAEIPMQRWRVVVVVVVGLTASLSLSRIRRCLSGLDGWPLFLLYWVCAVLFCVVRCSSVVVVVRCCSCYCCEEEEGIVVFYSFLVLCLFSKTTFCDERCDEEWTAGMQTGRGRSPPLPRPVFFLFFSLLLILPPRLC